MIQCSGLVDINISCNMTIVEQLTKEHAQVTATAGAAAETVAT